jgi:hypothetical protein
VTKNGAACCAGAAWDRGSTSPACDGAGAKRDDPGSSYAQSLPVLHGENGYLQECRTPAIANGLSQSTGTANVQGTVCSEWPSYKALVSARTYLSAPTTPYLACPSASVLPPTKHVTGIHLSVPSYSKTSTLPRALRLCLSNAADPPISRVQAPPRLPSLDSASATLHKQQALPAVQPAPPSPPPSPPTCAPRWYTSTAAATKTRKRPPARRREPPLAASPTSRPSSTRKSVTVAIVSRYGPRLDSCVTVSDECACSVPPHSLSGRYLMTAGSTLWLLAMPARLVPLRTARSTLPLGRP